VGGLPRTGTTLTVNLLSQDPAHRPALKWEISEPVPPAAAGELRSDPRCLAKKETQRRRVAVGELQTNVHFEWADEPTECVFIHMQDFKSAGWDTFLPNPEYSEFFLACDMEPAYRWHKRLLQNLQANNGGRWLLKAPSHALFADALLKVYPDARIVWTHRDPLAAVASTASLAAGVHKRFRPEPDMDWIRRYYPGQLLLHADRMEATEKRVPAQVYNLMYDDLVADPLVSMRQLYEWLGDDFTPEAQGGIRRWLAANPQGKLGSHSYRLEDFGISEASVRDRFGPYMKRFGFQ
jgi:hypothetical protein